jgi:hypothetical protein
MYMGTQPVNIMHSDAPLMHRLHLLPAQVPPSSSSPKTSLQGPLLPYPPKRQPHHGCWHWQQVRWPCCCLHLQSCLEHWPSSAEAATWQSLQLELEQVLAVQGAGNARFAAARKIAEALLAAKEHGTLCPVPGASAALRLQLQATGTVALPGESWPMSCMFLPAGWRAAFRLHVNVCARACMHFKVHANPTCHAASYPTKLPHAIGASQPRALKPTSMYS